MINCAAWTDVDGAEEDEDGRDARQRHGRGASWPRAAAKQGAKIIYVSSDYVFDGQQRRPYVESDLTDPISAYGRSKQAGETSTAVSNPLHLIVRSSWLYGTHGRNFVETMLRLAGEQPEVIVVSDQVGAPTYTRHLAAALAELAEGEDWGIHHVAGVGPLLVVRLRAGDLRPGRLRMPRHGRHHRDARAPGAPTALLGPRARSGTAHAALPEWREGLREYLRERKKVPSVSRLLVTGRRRLHRLGLRAPSARSESGRRGPGARQAHLRGPAREPRRASSAASSWSATSPTPTSVAEAIEGCDALVNFAAESHVDRSIEAPGEFIQTDVFGTFVLLEAARRAGIRHLQISTDEVYGSIDDGLVHRGVARSTPRRRTRRPRRAATCSSAPTSAPMGPSP